MKPALFVNAALDELATLVGQDIAMEGVLRFEFEGTAMDHFPKSERRNAQDDGPLEPSSVWLSVGSRALRFNEEQSHRAICTESTTTPQQRILLWPIVSLQTEIS